METIRSETAASANRHERYDTERLRTGLRELGAAPSDEQIEKLLIYYEQLVERNKQLNLTAITEYEEVVEKHFVDSAALIKSGHLKDGTKLIDIGSGAGFPGIVLAILQPQMKITLLETLEKRCAFLREMTEVLMLENVEVISARAEDAGRDTAHRAQYDIACSRAVADLAVLTEYSLPLLKRGGIMAAYKGPEPDEELTGAQSAIKLLGGELAKIMPYELRSDEGTLQRNLVLVVKSTETPEKYPRRAGIPTKRPLK